MTIEQIRRRLWGLGAVGLVVLVGFVIRGVYAVRSEAVARDALVASRVFDELERALTTLLEEEEERPFLHFTARYNVANEGGLEIGATSPLVERVPDGFYVGWFQRSGTSFTTPLSGHAGIAVADLRRVKEELTSALSTIHPRLDENRPAKVAAQAVLGKLNRASVERVQNVQNQMVQAQQVTNFLEPERMKRGVEPETRAEVMTSAVTVAPYRVSRGGPYWVWERQVSTPLGERSQGLVLHRAQVLDSLRSMVLADVPEVTLSWDPAEVQYRFEPPFDDLTASVEIEQQPLGSASVFAMSGVALFGLLLTCGWLGRAWLAAAEERARERTDFIASVTHELRTPLTSIRLYTEMLEGGMAPPDQQTVYLATIRSEAERLSQLVEGVLTFARLERRTGASQTQRTLGEVVEEMRTALEPLFEREGVLLLLDVSAASSVLVPRESVLQILHNLVDNGRKFSVGCPTRQVTVSASVEPLVLTVSDTGPGVEPSVQARLFEPFVRGRHEGIPGSGIGLAVVAGLVEELGGTVRTLDSAVGLTVEVVLPRDVLQSKPGHSDTARASG